ncbi:hypothetical protein [Streptomyces sp. H39-S7]|uniref:hypothetical protein n=1 Tax=Streptomyces sp. H39-S7 TaxID=3004357 RepID=UPI003FA6E8DA
MVLADAGRAITLGAAAMATLLGWLGRPALFVVAFAVGASAWATMPMRVCPSMTGGRQT